MKPAEDEHVGTEGVAFGACEQQPARSWPQVPPVPHVIPHSGAGDLRATNVDRVTTQCVHGHTTASDVRSSRVGAIYAPPTPGCYVVCSPLERQARRPRARWCGADTQRGRCVLQGPLRSRRQGHHLAHGAVDATDALGEAAILPMHTHT